MNTFKIIYAFLKTLKKFNTASATFYPVIQEQQQNNNSSPKTSRKPANQNPSRNPYFQHHVKNCILQEEFKYQIYKGFFSTHFWQVKKTSICFYIQ